MIVSRVPTRDAVRSTSSAKIVDVIIGLPSVKSRGSLILLQDYYRGQEVAELSKQLNYNLNNEDFKKSSNYSLLQILRKEFNKRFLNKSVLTCEYCKKENLNRFVKKRPNKKDKHLYATVDHRIPLIDGCDWFSEKNLAICCDKCNNEKQDMSYKEWCSLKKYLTCI